MLRLRRAATMALCAIATVLFTVSTASPAHAWTFSAWTTVYNGADFCVQGQAGIDHVRRGTASGNLAFAGVQALTAGCGAVVGNRIAAVRLDVYRWNGVSWQVCRATDWAYGTTNTDQWRPTGPTQVYDYGGAVCGIGNYGTMAYAFVWDGIQWRGGAVWSGYEFLP